MAKHRPSRLASRLGIKQSADAYSGILKAYREVPGPGNADPISRVKMLTGRLATLSENNTFRVVQSAGNGKNWKPASLGKQVGVAASILQTLDQTCMATTRRGLTTEHIAAAMAHLTAPSGNHASPSSAPRQTVAPQGLKLDSALAHAHAGFDPWDRLNMRDFNRIRSFNPSA